MLRYSHYSRARGSLKLSAPVRSGRLCLRHALEGSAVLQAAGKVAESIDHGELSPAGSAGGHADGLGGDDGRHDDCLFLELKV